MKCFLQQPKRPTTALPTNSIQSTGIPGDTLQEKLYSCLSIPAQTHRPPPPGSCHPGKPNAAHGRKLWSSREAPEELLCFKK